MTLSVKEVQKLAGYELNALYSSKVLGRAYDRVNIPDKGTPIYDLNGTLLYYRLPLNRGRSFAGYVDMAAEKEMGGPIISTSEGIAWNEFALKRRGASMAKKMRRRIRFNEIRFVAFSFPKIGLQFLYNKREVLMLELYSWKEVPPKQVSRRNKLEPGNFERWSFLEEMPEKIRKSRAKEFDNHLSVWNESSLKRIDPRQINLATLQKFDQFIKLVDSRELHYSLNHNDHSPCYELRGQQTNVWCVAASVEMLLLFYRYTYDQVRLATELGLGTLNNPNGLPYSRVGDVVTVIEALTSQSLDTTMHTNPSWTVFKDQIRANRPLISFVPGHSRTVAGYTQSLISFNNQLPLKGLLVYDPWPPNQGVITKWENFDTHNYQYAYSAVIKQV